jgi:hypothetical protein
MFPSDKLGATNRDTAVVVYVRPVGHILSLTVVFRFLVLSTHRTVRRE